MSVPERDYRLRVLIETYTGAHYSADTRRLHRDKTRLTAADQPSSTKAPPTAAETAA